jgi:hypothetical protein
MPASITGIASGKFYFKQYLPFAHAHGYGGFFYRCINPGNARVGIADDGQQGIKQ